MTTVTEIEAQIRQRRNSALINAGVFNANTDRALSEGNTKLARAHLTSAERYLARAEAYTECLRIIQQIN